MMPGPFAWVDSIQNSIKLEKLRWSLNDCKIQGGKASIFDMRIFYQFLASWWWGQWSDVFWPQSYNTSVHCFYLRFSSSGLKVLTSFWFYSKSIAARWRRVRIFFGFTENVMQPGVEGAQQCITAAVHNQSPPSITFTHLLWSSRRHTQNWK